jgi:hypothetical protein
MSKYVCLLFLSLCVTAFAGCSGPKVEDKGEGDPKAMTEPGAMNSMTGGSPEQMKKSMKP